MMEDGFNDKQLSFSEPKERMILYLGVEECLEKKKLSK